MKQRIAMKAIKFVLLQTRLKQNNMERSIDKMKSLNCHQRLLIIRSYYDYLLMAKSSQFHTSLLSYYNFILHHNFIIPYFDDFEICGVRFVEVNVIYENISVAFKNS